MLMLVLKLSGMQKYLLFRLKAQETLASVMQLVHSSYTNHKSYNHLEVDKRDSTLEKQSHL